MGTSYEGRVLVEKKTRGGTLLEFYKLLEKRVKEIQRRILVERSSSIWVEGGSRLKQRK